MSESNSVMNTLVSALRRIQELAIDTPTLWDMGPALDAIVKECEGALLFWDAQPEAARKRALDQLVADAQAMGPYE